jgi:flagellar motor switch protein FliG
MDIEAKRKESGEFELEIGPVMFSLPVEVVEALHTLLEQRLNHPSVADDESHQRKLTAYRALASKMIGVDDRIVQKFAPQVAPEQLVTIVRLAEGDGLYNKIVKNLSKQYRRQFEEDYAALDKITEQNACLHMEQLVPLIKSAAQEQKVLQVTSE